MLIYSYLTNTGSHTARQHEKKPVRERGVCLELVPLRSGTVPPSSVVFFMFAKLMEKTERHRPRIAVDVKIPAALREYVICVNGGSSVLHPDKDSILWCLLKQHLETCDNWLPIPPEERDQYIQIELRNVANAKTWSVPSEKKVGINVLSRFYLTTKCQSVIARYLNTCFKSSFRDYMLGATSNSDMSIAAAIEEFCSEYDITFENVSYATLRKDWYRYRERRQKTVLNPLLK